MGTIFSRNGRKSPNTNYLPSSGLVARITRRRSNRENFALAIAFTLLAAIALPVSPAYAGVGLGVVPDFPTVVTVGATNQPATFSITNVSDGGQSVGNVTLDSLLFVPSCSGFIPLCAVGTPDPTAFDLSATGTGAANTACAGTTFNITPTANFATTGEVEFVPVGGPVVLGPPSLVNNFDRCVINFTFDVIHTPNHDSSGSAGIQTNQSASAHGVHDDTTEGSGTGTDTTTVTDPVIVTQATGPVEVGSTVSDSATLSGSVNPTGNITFTLFGPNNPTCAVGAGQPIFTSTVPVSGTGAGPFVFNSGPSQPLTAPGNYNWVAVYSGNATNHAATSPCGAPNELSVVTQATPELTTDASGPVNVGQPINDVATLSGGFNPTGTITFTLFGPNNPTCTVGAGQPTFTSTPPVTVNGNGVYTSPSFTPTLPGTYQWIATYSGDANNSAIATACADPLEAVVVNQAAPTISTVASPSVQVGGQISDTASLAGGANPTGTITFTLFGPNNTTCAVGAGQPVHTSVIPVAGNGAYTSTPFTTTAPGEYRWVAVYSGDANNVSVTSPCNAPNEIVVVTQAGPTIVTVASADTTIGNSISDTATLAGGVSPTGTITFTLFGPNNPTCAVGGGQPIHTSVVAVNGNGNYISTSFTPTAPGTYQWVAVYSGDGNNAGTTSPCGAPNEDTVVSQVTPAIVTNVTPTTANLNQPVTDTATLSGGLAPTGTITFTAFGPNNATCAVGTGQPLYTSVVPVNGNGTYTATPPFVPTAPGVYRFVAAYSGDANNAAVTAPCNAPNESVTVLVGPSIDIDKQVTPLTMQAPGGDFTYSIVITNTSTVPLVLTSLDDDVYGNIFTRPEPNTCDSLAGTTLAPGASTAPCTFTGTFTGVPGDSETDTATVVGTDSSGNTATANDDAIVTLTPPPLPTIAVDKTVLPLSRPAPGGDFTFRVVVTNTGTIPITITSLTDDIYGNLATRGEPNNCDELIGDVLAPGASTAPCTFTAPFNGPAGASQTDVVTVVGTDQFGRTATDFDDALVSLFAPPPPVIAVEKTVVPSSLPVPGGDFTFSVVVTNPGTTPITITSLTDDIYGDLATRPGANTCDDLIGDVLQPGASTAPCSFTAPFNSASPASQTDIVTVIGTDAAGTTATDSDDATVTLFPPTAPQIALVKTASPLTRVAPGGTFTFTVVVTNPGTIPVTITSLIDNIYGNIGAPSATSTCDDLIGDVLQPGASSAPCSFDGPFNGAAGASQTDIVTVTGTGNGQTVTASDDAVVTLVAPPPLSILVDKTASPLSRPAPGGDFTFTVVVINPGTVALTITSLTDNIYGNIGAASATSTCDDLIGTVVPAGASSPPCTFTGPFNGVAGASQTDVVTVVGTDQFGQTATDNDDATVTLTTRATPQIRVDKTVSPTSRPAPGGSFTFSVVVSNPGTVPVVITSLVDDVYGNLATLPEPNTCDDLIGDTVAPGASTAPCSFTVTFNGAVNATQTDIVTVIGTDEIGQTATDNDDAVITLFPPPPGPISIRLDKSATPASRLEPGGTFTFNLVVTNTSNVSLTITSLVDDVYGNLATRSGVNTCDDLIGDVLAPGASTNCSFQAEFTGNSGDEQTDVVTVTGRDSTGRTTEDDDDADVELTDVLPQLQVVKEATPLERVEPGGSFTFKVEVKNPGTEPITLTDLVDDIYGDLNGKGTCSTGGVIPAGGSYICQFTAEFTGKAGQSQTDVVKATGEDDEGNEAEDVDDAVVKLVAAPKASPTPSPTPPPTSPPPPPVVTPKPPAALARTGQDFLVFFALGLALIMGGLVMRSTPVPELGMELAPSKRRRKKDGRR